MELPTEELSRQLIGIRYSPFTEKARWALARRGVSYSYREHLIIFGMPELRWRTRLWSKDITVPVMISKDDLNRRSVLLDSWDIALYADSIGSGEKLFPPEKLGEIQALNALSEQALDAGRAAVMERTRLNRGARIDSLPPFIPKFLRPFLTFLVDIGLKYLSLGFHVDRKTLAEHDSSFRECLKRFDEIVAKVGYEGPVYGKFSYADVIIAAPLQFVSPLEPKLFGLTPALEEAWTDSKWEQEFPKLFEWRRKLYAKYRH